MSTVHPILSRRLRQVRNQLPIFAKRANTLSEQGSRAHAAEIRKARRKLHLLQAEERALLSELGMYEENVTYMLPATSYEQLQSGWRRRYKTPKVK